jgi:hypothetical protein
MLITLSSSGITSRKSRWRWGSLAAMVALSMFLVMADPSGNEASPLGPSDEIRYDAIEMYDEQSVEGWRILVNKRLLAEDGAYFGTNDFYPFVRAELKQHDPEMHDLIENLWRVPESHRGN